jgi:hypothetical protein
MKSKDNSNSSTEPPPDPSGLSEEPPSHFASPKCDATIPFYSIANYANIPTLQINFKAGGHERIS